MERVRLGTFDLPPDDKDHRITVTIPAAVWPYVKKWFNAKVAEGESRSGFIRRLVLERAMVYREQTLLEEFKLTIQNALEEEEVAFHEAVNNTRASLTATAADSETEHLEEDPI
jgi:hypothetical protein